MNTTPPDNAILLHACCGPCSITPVLRLLDQGLLPTLYFYNPNIHPLPEYLRRREGLLAVAQRLGVDVILPDQQDPADAEPDVWLAAVAGLGAGMADMARRCPLCYDLRLERAAACAREAGFTRFSSTLLYSKYQNHQAILDAGVRHAGPGLDFLGEDFRPSWDEGIRLSKEWEIYRQPYCGCLLSAHDRYRKAVRIKT
ncbi:MAG TPA: epoxyqueuosine reductase QueH [Humidesulfovibrio sp.]|uniref:epoxyqueuosine reductase QueH n=1 Tax=Humidesulfovibrio sp. TaxID=2910988 RepID=UPI002B5F93DB|nr:epoxyqueuosine reductase QueH [Humidesulfovibrio sp.]HWR03225.1 epoxyqueuosine reductase QueH [Humidesulfovibrio sp.]